MPTETQRLVRQFFQAKTRQLRASAQLPVCEHNGLTGSHREEVHRIYLREILPRRYSVGRGMIYSAIGSRSREVDIVIWDSLNYPSLPMTDHSFFFSESVRGTVECKSTFSSEELENVCVKSQSVRDIVDLYQPSLGDTIQMLKQDVWALTNGVENGGTLITPYHIGTTAIFLTGGKTFDASCVPESCKEIDERWPDIMLFLEHGRLFVKKYSAEGNWLHIYELGDDSLGMFTHFFMELLSERSLQTEPEILFQAYLDMANEFVPIESIQFRSNNLPGERYSFLG